MAPTGRDDVQDIRLQRLAHLKDAVVNKCLRKKRHEEEFMHKRRNVNSEPNLSEYSLTFEGLLESFGLLILSYHEEKTILGPHRNGLCPSTESNKVLVQLG